MSNPYIPDPPSGAAPQAAQPELARIEHSLLEVVNTTKDIFWQMAQLKSAIENEGRRSSEFRSAVLQEQREMRHSVDKLTATVEFLKSGLSVATASHGGVQANRKW